MKTLATIMFAVICFPAARAAEVSRRAKMINISGSHPR
jgi:hypothetical protein